MDCTAFRKGNGTPTEVCMLTWHTDKGEVSVLEQNAPRPPAMNSCVKVVGVGMDVVVAVGSNASNLSTNS